MARRDSVSSRSSGRHASESPIAPRSQLPSGAQVWQPPRSVSLAGQLSTIKDDEEQVDPDDLFVRHTVAEVKAIQSRLRSDADAKQEELRLMVGERYRELLQASASIVSMSQSSEHVMLALEEMKATVSEQTHVRTHSKSHSSVTNDSRLRTLQSLAAHVKLLLDTPEHLWRLLERKKYLHATWLFLLARVVHRSLSSDDFEDEEGWQNQGIDIVEQFPLAQRQWDAVSHFRPQITHKATLALRETKISTEDVCAILLTLHLIDSRPLTEALSVFLTQRSKTLAALVRQAPTAAGSKKGLVNGSNATNGHARTKRPRSAAKDVRLSVQAVLELISGTVGTARDAFSDDSGERTSLVSRVLNFIQKDTSSPHAPTVPPDLQLTTQTFLSALPSSSHLLLLPTNLKFYKPYVDLSSTSSYVTMADLARKLDHWFHGAIQQLENALQTWCAELESIRQVWKIRAWVSKWVEATVGLEAKEKKDVKMAMDQVCRKRVVAIWTTALADIEVEFHTNLQVAIAKASGSEATTSSDISAAEHLFKATLPPDPTLGKSSFEDYKDSLRRCVTGRTPLLESVLSSLETRAGDLQSDLNAMTGEDHDSRSLAHQLMEMYKPDAEGLCEKILAILSAESKQVTESSSAESTWTGMFIGWVSHSLSSSSPFLGNTLVPTSPMQDFQAKTHALYDEAIARRREHTVSLVIGNYMESLNAISSARTVLQQRDTVSSHSPSPSFMQCLLRLSTSVQELGMFHEHSQRRIISERTLALFVASLSQRIDPESARPQSDQLLLDLLLLRELVISWGPPLAKSRAALDSKIEALRKEKPHTNGSQPSTSGHLLRTQLYLDPLLPPLLSPTADGSTHLLRFGAPSADQQFHAALELVKPSQRFGLLLVGDAAGA